MIKSFLSYRGSFISYDRSTDILVDLFIDLTIINKNHALDWLIL